jgi:glycosyltransferase involved in cell wall biosynthesis
MRILYIMIDGLPTFRPDITALWEKYLPPEGVTADMVTQRPADVPADADLWPSGEAFTTHKRGNALANGIADFTHDCAQLKQATPDRYAAVQVRDKTFAALVGLIVARMRGLPFFYWMSFPYGPSLLQLGRTEAVRRNLPRRFYLWWRGYVGERMLHSWVLPRADHVFAQSDRMVDDLAARGVPRSLMTAVPMCIDPDRFPDVLPCGTLAGVPEGARVLGYLGECSKARRMDFLIEAVARARESRPVVYLLIVGDALLPEEQKWLRECVAKFGMADRCRITGWLPPEEATASLSAAEICLALMAPDPILDSTTPTKLVEYLAMGRPVVANDHPDQTVVVEASGAGVVAPYDSAAYAEAIVALLDRREEHGAMAEAGRRFVLAERSYPKMAARLAGKYRALIAATKAGKA